MTNEEFKKEINKLKKQLADYMLKNGPKEDWTSDDLVKYVDRCDTEIRASIGDRFFTALLEKDKDFPETWRDEDEYGVKIEECEKYIVSIMNKCDELYETAKNETYRIAPMDSRLALSMEKEVDQLKRGVVSGLRDRLSDFPYFENYMKSCMNDVMLNSEYEQKLTEVLRYKYHNMSREMNYKKDYKCYKWEQSFIRTIIDDINDKHDHSIDLDMVDPRRHVRYAAAINGFEKCFSKGIAFVDKETKERAVQEVKDSVTRFIIYDFDREELNAVGPELAAYAEIKDPAERIKEYEQDQMHDFISRHPADDIKQQIVYRLIDLGCDREDGKNDSWYDSRMCAGIVAGVRDALREYGYEEEAKDFSNVAVIGFDRTGRKTYAKLDTIDGEFAEMTPLQKEMLKNADFDTVMFESRKQNYIKLLESASSVYLRVKGKYEKMMIKKRECKGKKTSEKKWCNEYKNEMGAMYAAMEAVTDMNGGTTYEEEEILNAIKQEFRKMEKSYPDTAHEAYLLLGDAVSVRDKKEENMLMYGMISKMMSKCMGDEDILESSIKEIGKASADSGEKVRNAFTKALYLMYMDASLCERESGDRRPMNGDIYTESVYKSLMNASIEDMGSHESIDDFNKMMKNCNEIINDMKKDNEMCSKAKERKEREDTLR